MGDDEAKDLLKEARRGQYALRDIGHRYDQRFQIALSGNSHVGKTTLFVRMCTHKYVQGLSETIMSDTASFDLTSQHKHYEITITDTAGTERYTSTTVSLYRRKHLILLLYDITDRSSFVRLTFWADEVLRVNPTARVMLVGSKSDLHFKREIKPELAYEWVRRRRAQHKQHITFYGEISSKTGEGLECMKLKLITLLSTLNIPKRELSIKLNQPTVQHKGCC